MKTATVFILLMALVLASATSLEANQQSAQSQSDAGPAASSANDELMSQGLEVYRQHYCGLCHQLTLAGTNGAFGPTHDGMGELARARIESSDYQGAATTPTEYIRESIIHPDAYIVPGYSLSPHRMPAYRELTEQELDALVYLLLQQ